MQARPGKTIKSIIVEGLKDPRLESFRETYPIKYPDPFNDDRHGSPLQSMWTDA